MKHAINVKKELVSTYGLSNGNGNLCRYAEATRFKYEASDTTQAHKQLPLFKYDEARGRVCPCPSFDCPTGTPAASKVI